MLLSGAGIVTFGITKLAGFVDFLVCQADFRRAYRFRIGSGALVGSTDLATLLRCVIFISEAALRRTFNIERISLRVHNRAETCRG